MAPGAMFQDGERCRRAVRSKDARFDGWFFTAVVTTGIYCRPSCPVAPPKPDHMRFYPSAAAAQSAGFRACKRCRPDATPGSPEWDRRGDVTARAMRLIADGVVDREGVPGLAAQVGYHRRQLERHLQAELGAGPLALARAQRAQTARLLIETTPLPLTQVAFAAGFGSVRQFNDTVLAVFAIPPGELRRLAKGRQGGGPATAVVGTVVVRLPFRSPLHPGNLFGHLAATAVEGIEEWRGGAYRRTLRLPHGPGIVSLTPGDGAVTCALSLHDLRDLATAISRCRRLLDLDADPVAVDEALSDDPVLAPLVAAAPGRRVPRTVDEHELAIRTVLGQQVSTAAAGRHAARLVERFGDPIDDPGGGLSHLWPSVEALAGADPSTFALPRARQRALGGLIRALADGSVSLSPGVDRDVARAQLLSLPGIGPWTVEIIAQRALGDPDAFPVGDLGVVQGAVRLGLPDTPSALGARARRWSPWRAYAATHLSATGPHPAHHLPPISTGVQP